MAGGNGALQLSQGIIDFFQRVQRRDGESVGLLFIGGDPQHQTVRGGTQSGIVISAVGGTLPDGGLCHHVEEPVPQGLPQRADKSREVGFVGVLERRKIQKQSVVSAGGHRILQNGGG